MNKIKFAHFRKTHLNGVISNLGGATMAYKELGGDKFLIAFAWCSDKDNFNKSIGRAKAAGRLNSQKYSITTMAKSAKDLIEMEKRIMWSSYGE